MDRIALVDTRRNRRHSIVARRDQRHAAQARRSLSNFLPPLPITSYMPNAAQDVEVENAPLPLSYRVATKAITWDSLVLADTIKFRLRRIAHRWRTKSLVLKHWGLGERVKGDGLVCLFSGAPGTGKSVAAQLIADEVGIPLYR